MHKYLTEQSTRLFTFRHGMLQLMQILLKRLKCLMFCFPLVVCVLRLNLWKMGLNVKKNSNPRPNNSGVSSLFRP